MTLFEITTAALAVFGAICLVVVMAAWLLPFFDFNDDFKDGDRRDSE